VKDVKTLDQALKSALADSFKKAPKVLGDSEIRGGFEVGFKGSEVYFDFTEAAVTELVADYIGPRLAKILKGE